MQMKNLPLFVAIIGCLTAVETASVTSAEAVVVHRTVTMHHGPMGHGCRTVRTAVRGPHGKRVVVRRICG
jgi:hypothetical protein